MLAQAVIEWRPYVDLGLAVVILGYLVKGVSQWTKVELQLQSGDQRMGRMETAVEKIRVDTSAIPVLQEKVANLEKAVERLENAK